MLDDEIQKPLQASPNSNQEHGKDKRWWKKYALDRDVHSSGKDEKTPQNAKIKTIIEPYLQVQGNGSINHHASLCYRRNHGWKQLWDGLNVFRGMWIDYEIVFGDWSTRDGPRVPTFTKITLILSIINNSDIIHQFCS